jgi:uncharacterized protein
VEIDTVLVKVASRCNINCSYCYVYNMGDEGWKDMPSLISRNTVGALSKALGQLSQDQERPFATVFHGGEPLMLGSRRLEFLLQSLRSALPTNYPLCMQTNGMLITREILDLCAKHGVSISVSLDGPKAINDRFRLDKRGQSTHERVVTGIELLRTHSSSSLLYAGLLCVIDPASSAPLTYDYFKSLGAPSVDFLYRDGNHSDLPFGKSSFESTEYADWLSELLDLYLSDPNPPKIRFLDDIIRLCLGGRGIKEGLGQQEYGIAIIETDGTVTKNDTLKSSFNGADRFIQKWSVHTDRLSEVFESAEFKGYHAVQNTTSRSCQACEYLKICGGGMPLHRWKEGTGFDNPSVYCADQKVIIGKIIGRLKAEGLV